MLLRTQLPYALQAKAALAGLDQATMQAPSGSTMKFTVQTESPSLFKEALGSLCDGIRFGAEFCEWKIPDLEALRRAHIEAKEAGKAFTYVTPITSNVGIDKLREQLAYIKEAGDTKVTIGDVGVLNLLQKYDGIRLHLGRPRVYIPARCPWPQITRMPNPSFLTRLKVEKIFYQTSLNYARTLEYYKSLGIVGADVDWITKGFNHLKPIIKKGFCISVHTHAIPVAVTMRCHMARFLGEEDPALCSKPCFSEAFAIKQTELQRSFILHGNVVFRQAEHTHKDVRQLQRLGVDELIIPMGPVSGILTGKDVDDAIATLSVGV